MSYARIMGTGSYLPERVVTNHEIATYVDTSHEWVVGRTGIEQRHYVAEGETTSDQACHAARRAMEAAGVTAGEIDLIIVGTTSPDQVFPSVACTLQAELGIKPCAAFDVQAVCSGFVYALSVADKFVASGQNQCALVVGAESLSRYLDPEDRSTNVLFGDEAGAVVLKRDNDAGILSSHLYADGSLGDILRIEGSIEFGEIKGHPYVEMNGGAVFKTAVKALCDSAAEALSRHGFTAGDVDWFVPHQANLRIIGAVSERLGMPEEKVITTVNRHGNTSAASVPLALDIAVRDGRIQPDDVVLMEAVGGGMTWGAVLMRM